LSDNLQDKIDNWNKINSKICNGYFKNRFYLLNTTIRELSEAKSSQTILRVLKAMLQTYEEYTGEKVLKITNYHNVKTKKKSDLKKSGSSMKMKYLRSDYSP